MRKVVSESNIGERSVTFTKPEPIEKPPTKKSILKGVKDWYNRQRGPYGTDEKGNKIFHYRSGTDDFLAWKKFGK